MSRRLDLELTSRRDDGTWTWRAAGAKQPKGVLDGRLLYDGASVGDVVRAEADVEVDGIFVTVVHAPKRPRSGPARLEVTGSGKGSTPGVTTELAGRRGGAPEGHDGAGRGRSRHPQAGAGERPRRAPTEPGQRPRRRPGGPEVTGGARRPPRPDAAGRDAKPRRSAGTERATPSPPRPKRLVAGNAHRTAALGALPPEQVPVAEQLLRGGMPAVRQAVEAQNEQLRQQGLPEIKAEALLTLAEELLPGLKAAEWRDRAEAAAKDAEHVALRDLRSVVAGANVARGDEARALAGALRDALERRLAEARDTWTAEMESALSDGRVVRALRVAARPPDPTIRFPADLALRLGDAAGAALAPDAPPDRWLAVLEAIADSPVRRSVKPTALPADATGAVVEQAKRMAGRVPALAPLLGITMPPPPGPPPRPRPAPAAPRGAGAGQPADGEPAVSPQA